MFVLFMCLVFALGFAVWALVSLIEWWGSFTFAEEWDLFKSVIANHFGVKK